MTDPEPTVLIVGAGTFGASTALHLSKQYSDPSRITLLDRWDPNAPLLEKHAAAIDTNRIIRTDYESPLYCNLANESIHFWFWNIAVQGLFRKTGWIVVDKKNGEFGDAVRKTFQDRGGDYTRDVEAKELEEKYAMLRGFSKTPDSDYGKAYFNPEAGWCDAEKATASFTRVATNNGVQRITATAQSLLFNTNTSHLEGVLTTCGRTIKADRIILATGAWTSALLSPLEDTLHIPFQDRIERQITAVGRLSAYYTLPSSPVSPTTETHPVIVLANDLDIIPPSPQNQTLKINDLRTEITHTMTTPTGHKITTPHPSSSQNDPPSSLTQKTLSLIHRVLPSFSTAHPHPTRYRICYDAVTPTEDWLISRHPHSKLGNLFLAVGGSFHSYKFLPVVGGCVARVLEGRSNGVERDGAWGWKSEGELGRGGGKEFGEAGRRGVGERVEFGEFVLEGKGRARL